MSLANEEYAQRRKITFAQAEGVEKLPSQMNRDEISRSMRAKLWALMYKTILHRDHIYGISLGYPWSTIVNSMWVGFSHNMIDDINGDVLDFVEYYLKPIFEKGPYVTVYGALEYILRHESCPSTFRDNLQALLKEEQAAFRIVNGDTFFPVSSEEEIQAVEFALSQTHQSNLAGARTHLLESTKKLSSGLYADSVRESIHAVESLARKLAPSGKLSDALATLENAGLIHKAMKKGFESLYGYASDEEGVRHPLLDSASAEVNEADALFMLGACASFVSYMISRAREAGLIL